MSVDVTFSFALCLVLLAFESLLFCAVVLQTKNQEIISNGGVAQSFGFVFLFQALSALMLALSEALYEGYFSLYFSILCVIFTFFSVLFCIPAAMHVAVPDEQREPLKTGIGFVWGVVIVFIAVFLSPMFASGPDIPYMTAFLRKGLLGAVIGAFIVLAVASLIRMWRNLEGRNGAFILFTGLSLAMAFGLVWMHYEPLCAQGSGGAAGTSTDWKTLWNTSCPLPREFDHNVLFTSVLIVANVLCAEGVLRLMAAGTGSQGYSGYVDIITVQ